MKYLCKCAMNIFRLKILSFIPGNSSLPRIKVFPIKVGLVSLRTFPWFSRNLRQIDDGFMSYDQTDKLLQILRRL